MLEDPSEPRAFHTCAIRSWRPLILRRANRRSAVLQLVAHNRSHLSAQNLYRAQHFLVRKRGYAHLECDARDAAESFVYVKDFFRDRSSVTYQQRSSGPALCVELRAGGGRPAAFLADFGKSVCVTWKESIRGFVCGVREKADGMKTDSEAVGGMAGASPGFAVEVNERAETYRLAADDGDHERKSEHSRANKGFGRAAHTDPYRQRILQRTRVDCLAVRAARCLPDQCTAVLARIFNSRSSFSAKSES